MLSPTPPLIPTADHTAAELFAMADRFEQMAAGCAGTPLGKLSMWAGTYLAEANYIRTLAEIAATESRVA